MKRSSVFGWLCVCVCVASASIPSRGVCEGAPPGDLSPLNPKFVEFSSKRAAGGMPQNFGIVPDPVDMSYMTGVQLVDPKTAASFPSSYDLRSVTGKLPAVRSQGTDNTCWAFAAYGSLESCLMPGETWDFSERHMACKHGFDEGIADGGNYKMATAYLARWGSTTFRDGPVNETDYPYSWDCSHLSPAVVKHVQHVFFLPNRGSSLDNNNIKYAVSTYGAVQTSMYMDPVLGNPNPGTSPYYDPTNFAYYQTAYTYTSTNHSICIVGWDDNYSSTKFKSTPAGNGAFICRNSWDTVFGESGYFYISYYDTGVGCEMACFDNAEPTDNYLRDYEYDPLGWTNSYGATATSMYCANIFTAADNEFLSAVSFYVTAPNTYVEVRIYKNVVGEPTSGTFCGKLYAATCEWPCYMTVDLPSAIPVSASTKFSVVLFFVTNPYTYPVAIERRIANHSSAASANPGESWVSTTGANWTDLTTVEANTNCCIKAFTTAGTLPQPTIVPLGGLYYAPFDAMVWCTDPSATIHYTTNGLTPTRTDPVVANYGTVLVDRSLTLKARAFRGYWTPGPMASEDFELKVPLPTFRPPPGHYTVAQNVAITSALAGTEIHYTTNGLEPTKSDPQVASGGTVAVAQTTWLRAKAWKTDGSWTPSDAASGPYLFAGMGDVIHVTPTGLDTNNGWTWATAKRTVGAGLAAAFPGVQVWVKGGVGCTFTECLNLNDGVELYGGFTGTENLLSERPPRTWPPPDPNETILDGNQAGSVISVASTASRSTKIDGFTIANGVAVLEGQSTSFGGGINCKSPGSSPTITNNWIRDCTAWFGGAICCGTESEADISENHIGGNTGSSDGGGIYCRDYSAPTIFKNEISYNHAPNGWGGGIGGRWSHGMIRNNRISHNNAGNGGGIGCYEADWPVVRNNIIANNSATSDGGGIGARIDTVLSIECNTIVGNTAGADGGGVCFGTAGANYNNNPSVANNIIYLNSSGIFFTPPGTAFLDCNDVCNNPGYNYSGLVAGRTDLALDPKFANFAMGDYHIILVSPCVNAGNNFTVHGGDVDMDGDARVFPAGGTVDIGADEHTWNAAFNPNEAKKLVADGQQTILTGGGGLVTTARLDGIGAFYIERPDRTSGIQCRGSVLLEPEQTAVVRGTMYTIGGERVLTNATTMGPIGYSTVPAPLGMSQIALGGGPYGLQAGVRGGLGLNNIGLLIKTCGSVTHREPGWFYIDDGSHLSDGSGLTGTKVYGTVPVPDWENPVGKFVTVLGVSSCEQSGTEVLRVVRTRGSGDVTVLN